MKTEKIKLTENKFFSYLGTEQLEDLTYIWLYDKYGYIVIPSTNKKGTQLYEFVLLNPKKEKLTKAYLQVKLGEVTLDSKKYRNLDGIVYLVTTQGEILNSNNTDNVCIIKSKELYEFAKNRNNWYVLPQSITSWFEME